MYGRMKETCHFEILMTTVLTMQEPPLSDDESRESDRKITNETEGGDEVINPEIVEDFEPWMLAKKQVYKVPITQSN